jgi:hypothetical protein
MSDVIKCENIQWKENESIVIEFSKTSHTLAT